MNNYLENIKNNSSVRQNLIDLKNLIKDGNQKKALAYKLAGDFSVFMDLLENEDPKIRKNAVLILGEMECDDLCQDIWRAYEKEQTMFVKPDYLKSLAKCECRELLPAFKKRMQELTARTVLPEEEKHVHGEITALQKLIAAYDTQHGHKFSGYDQEHTIILITNRNYREATANQLEEEEIKYLAGGIRLKTKNLRKILKIRTYIEMLFPIRGIPVMENMEEKELQKLAKYVSDFLAQSHVGEGAYCFRVEVKGVSDRDKKTALVKKISYALERLSNRTLINAPAGYEIEIRIVANRKGQYVPVLKLFTLEEERFAYRKEVLPTSIAPVNAALILELAKEYLKENAQVLDPFCGTGTMLIERSYQTGTSSMYGLDILEQAVEKARVNAALAHLPIHYINRDYFDFRHEYLFDEVISNLPVAGKTRSSHDVGILYERMFQKSKEVLKPSAVLILYTTMPELLQESMKRFPEYDIVNEYILNERDGSMCFVIRYHKS